MRVIKSVDTTDVILTSSNIPEDDAPVWVSGKSYAALDEVIYKHVVYQAILAHSNTLTPDLDTTNWLSLGATNRYRMFDRIISNVSTGATGIEFTLTPNQVVNSIALLNVNASTIRVVMNDPIEGVVYDKLKYLRTQDDVVDYYTYFFSSSESLGEIDSAVFLDLPSRPTASITVYVSSGAASVSVGEVIYGLQTVVGKTNYGTAVGITSYSRKDTDEFGSVTVVKRRNSKYADYDIDIENTNLAFIQRFFRDIDSVPCVFIGNPDMDELIIYGFYKDFKATISYPQISKCTLRVEGLI